MKRIVVDARIVAEVASDIGFRVWCFCFILLLSGGCFYSLLYML